MLRRLRRRGRYNVHVYQTVVHACAKYTLYGCGLGGRVEVRVSAAALQWAGERGGGGEGRTAGGPQETKRGGERGGVSGGGRYQPRG